MSDFNKKIFAKNLQYYMDKKGVDRYQLSEDTGFGYSTVSEWLQAKKFPRINRIEALAIYFGVSKSDLIEEHADERRSALIKKIEQIPESEVPRAEAIFNAVFDDTNKHE